LVNTVILYIITSFVKLVLKLFSLSFGREIKLAEIKKKSMLTQSGEKVILTSQFINNSFFLTPVFLIIKYYYLYKILTYLNSKDITLS